MVDYLPLRPEVHQATVIMWLAARLREGSTGRSNYPAALAFLLGYLSTKPQHGLCVPVPQPPTGRFSPAHHDLWIVMCRLPGPGTPAQWQ